MNETISEHRKFPVKLGERRQVKVVQKAKEDYFTKIDGFIVFLKGISPDLEGEYVTVEIRTIKEKYAFAYLIEE